MHSYIKRSDGTYVVGLWLVTGDSRGCTFSRMFEVGNWAAAMTAVNMLNGGDTAQIVKPTKES